MRQVPTTRRAVLAGLGASIAAPAAALDARHSVRPLLRRAAKAPGRYAPEVGDIIEAARLGGDLAYAVADARTGQVLEAKSQLKPMQPASVTKTITTLYALDRLGTGHLFRTRIIATGPLVDGVIQGDLVLAAGGDPTLVTDDLGDMAKTLADAGIKGISGRFLVYEPPYPSVSWIDPTQPFQVSYNPGVSGLNLNLNRVYFEWKRIAKDDYSVLMEAWGARYRPEVPTSTMEVVDRNGPVYGFTRSDGVDKWTVARSALGKEGARWLPVRAPRDYTTAAFQGVMAGQGIRLPEPQRTVTLPDGHVLTENVSKPLPDIMRYMLKESINLTAEVLGLTSTLQTGDRPNALVDSAQEMCDWLKQAAGARRPGFVDHSGLNDNNQITPRDMVAALTYAKPDGTLAGLMKPWYFRTEKGGQDRANPVTMSVKTGTLNFVSALAGYIYPPEGRDLAFAIFCRNDELRAGLSREERERPPGGKSWSRRSRVLQDKLLKRWTALYV